MKVGNSNLKEFKQNTMKTTTLIPKLFSMLAFALLFFAPAAVKAQQSKVETSVVKDGFVMMDGKMMILENGKMTPMKKNIVMENGTKIKKNGMIRTKDGKKIKMKNGNCSDKMGAVADCNVNSKYFTCTHHPEVRAAKDGKCPKCGMDLVQKN